MVEQNHCPHCGSKLPANAPSGVCPQCLLKAGLVDDPDITVGSPSVIEGPNTKIGRYELLELIGEGGMGLVYLAEQKEPVRRRVALKIVKLGMDTKQVVNRFEAERQTLAVLEHPNIAHVFDAGTTEAGRPYFVMEYVKGKSITKYCDENKLSIEKRLELFQQVCEGVHHAHQKGIIHRDIKPSNILVSVQDDKPVPKIIDFGIAKAITQPLTEKTSYTEWGQLLGTPEYMSPEQAEMAYQDIDTRSDIYSLGVVLYELLAGVPPFDAKRLREGGIDHIQQVICEEEPRTPSARLTSLGDKAKAVAQSRRTQIITLTRRLHRELEWIPMKAIRKDRMRRYRSASELADDIQNYLTGTPLIAGPESAVYRARKFVRKHAGSVATVALVAVAIVLGLIVSIALYFRAESAFGREAIARTRAEQARDKEAAMRAQVEQALVRAEQAEKAAKEKSEELRRTLYVNSIQLADAKYRDANIRRVRELLESCPNDLRGWEWDRLNHILDQSVTSIATGQDGIISLALGPDGKRVVSGGWDRTIKVWDLTSGTELIAINLGDKNAYLQALYHGDVDGLRQARSSLAWSIAFSPDGKQITSGHGSGEIKVWDSATGKQLMTFQGHKGRVCSIAFSPDGKRMASRGYEVKLWDTANWTELMSLSDRDSTDFDSCVTFSPDGKRIASAGGWGGYIRVWDIVSGQEIWSTKGHNYFTYSVSFSPDGKLLATGGDNDLKIWDVRTGSHVMSLRGHEASAYSVAFSPDGKCVASGGYDNMIRIWDIATGETMMTLRGHEHVVESVLFAPDGKRLVSRSWDGTVKTWDMLAAREPLKLVGHSAIINSFEFSPDGKRIVSVDGISIKLWDVESATELKTLCRDNGWVPSAVGFSPDGRRIALREYSGKCRIWDAATGDLLTTLRGPKPYIRPTGGMAFGPDSKLMAFSGGVDKTVKVWDATRGEEIATLKGHGSLVCSVAFSPDGRFIAAGGSDPNIKVWEWATGHEPMTLRGHDKGIIGCVAFSPDGKRIVSAGQQDQMVKVWDATTGAELMTLKHADSAISAAFSPDGKRIISGSHDRTVRVWDAETGAELLALRAGFSVLDVAFSPDGKTIAGGLFDHTITLWESASSPDKSDQRKFGEAARKFVDELHERHGWYRDVISQLQHEAILGPAVSKLALQIANSRKWEDTGKLENELENEAWKVIVTPDRDVKAYQAALEKAGKADALEPNRPPILTTLGAGQYRVGSYEDALKTLTKVERILSDTGEDPDPRNLAFKVMTLHRMGRTEEAKAALGQLRELCKDRLFSEEIELQGLLTEAEELIDGKKP